LSDRDGKRWGIDIGGTTTILGYLHNGGFEKADILKTDPSSGPGKLLRRIGNAVACIDKAPLSAGLGIAGLVNRTDGTLLSSPNLPGWKNVALRDDLSDILNCPVAIDNDCNVFAIQALELSRIPPSGLWLMITLGTGIGGTILQDGTIIYGTGYAGEFGHMTVEAMGKECLCGSRGCWEMYAASQALSTSYRIRAQEQNDRSPKEIAHFASQMDTAALDSFREFGTWLGIGLASMQRCLSPVGIYLAGGLMGASELFLPHAESEYRRRCGCEWNVNVLPDSSYAGAEGAAIMGRNRTE